MAALALIACVGDARSAALASDPWESMTLTRPEARLIFVCRSSLPDGIDIAQYPYALTVSWSYRATNVGRMPDPPTRERQSQFEANTAPALEKAGIAYLMQVLIGDDMTMWRWYARDVGEARITLEHELAGLQPDPIEINVRKDPMWLGWRALPCHEDRVYAQKVD